MPAPTRRPRGLAAALLAATAVFATTLSPSTTPVAAGAAGSAVASTQPADYRFLRAQVFNAPGLGQLAVGMPTPRVVKVQHRLEGESTWSAPTTLFRREGVTCGDIGGHASPGGVALILECDSPFYIEDAPVKSRAVVTRDLTTFAIRQLPGEAYTDPGISPSGEHAVWLAGYGGNFLTWNADSGFSPLRSSSFDSDSGGEVAVVADDGTVTIAGSSMEGRGCGVGLLAVTPDGAESEQRVALAPGTPGTCSEFSADAASSTRVTAADPRPENRWVVGRDDESSPWRVIATAPVAAPSLADWPPNPRRGIAAAFSSVPGQPLLALGSPDRRRIQVQSYDAAAQEWSPARTVYDHGFPGCTTDYQPLVRSSAVHALVLHCWAKRRADGDYPPQGRGLQTLPRDQRRVVLSADGATWRTVAVGARPVTPSLDRAQVAAPGNRVTTIVSASGVVRVPATTRGRCEAVLPTDPRGLLRLAATRGSRGFPARLQRWTGSRWRSIARVPVPAAGTCRRVVTFDADAPAGRFFFDSSSPRAGGLQVVRTSDGYEVRRTRGF
ncbi:hypothetical protein [Nocardioides nanhaiensis]|uniref:Exo-alpha-sialidase n=1 Tax=Nocardioides nanhaiensis TaxID=1476871 RepID=A0ABP8X2I0_9ACTN